MCPFFVPIYLLIVLSLMICQIIKFAHTFYSEHYTFSSGLIHTYKAPTLLQAGREVAALKIAAGSGDMSWQ